MAMKKGPGPTEPLDRKVVKTLLDRLSTDDDFRDLFQRDAHAALVEAGWKAPASPTTLAPADAAALSGGSCLQLASGTTQASKEQISAQRPKLEQSLNAVVNYAVPMELQGE